MAAAERLIEEGFDAVDSLLGDGSRRKSHFLFLEDFGPGALEALQMLVSFEAVRYLGWNRHSRFGLELSKWLREKLGASRTVSHGIRILVLLRAISNTAHSSFDFIALSVKLLFCTTEILLIFFIFAS